MKSTARLVFPLFLFLFTSAPTVPCLAEGNSRWTVNLPEDYRWYTSIPSGTLIVETDSGVSGISFAEGSVKWRLGGLGGMSRNNIHFSRGAFYAFVSLPDTVPGQIPYGLLDLDTGRMKWTIDTAESGTCRGYSFLNSINGLVLHAAKPGQKDPGTVMLLDLDTGRPLWKRSDFFAGWKPFWWKDGSSAVGRVAPVLDSDGNLIVFWGEDHLRKYDGRTGDLLWKSPMIKRGNKSPGALRSSRTADFFIAVWGGLLMAFNLADGKPLWSEPLEVDGRLRQFETVDQGFLIRLTADDTREVQDPFDEKKTREERWISAIIKFIDLRTGERRWNMGGSEKVDERGPGSLSSNFVVRDDSVMFAYRENLYSRSLVSGGEGPADRKLGFRNDDLPRVLERIDGRLLVVGSQNMSWFDSTGSGIQNVHHQIHGQGLLNLFLTEMAFGVVSDAFGVEYEPTTGLQSYSWSSSLADHVFMLTDERGYSEIIKIRKTDGVTVGSVPVVSEKYQIASDGSGVFMTRSKREFAFYGF